MFLLQKNLLNLEDELVVRKMKKISEEVKQKKRKVFSEKQVKQKYYLK